MRATVAGDPHHTTAACWSALGGSTMWASSDQRVFMLDIACSASHALVGPTPLAMVLDMCQ